MSTRIKVNLFIYRIIVDEFRPTKEDYPVKQPWKQASNESTLAALTQICRLTRARSLPLMWSSVYVHNMKDWGLLWKRISTESGQHIETFFNFWAIPSHAPFAVDLSKDMLSYAFVDRRQEKPYHIRDRAAFSENTLRYWNRSSNVNQGNGPDGHG